MERVETTEVELIVDDLSRQIAEKSQQAAMWRAKAIAFQSEIQRLQEEYGLDKSDIDSEESNE